MTKEDLMKLFGCNKINYKKACVWYEDEKGNKYENISEYKAEQRDKKLKQILE